MLLGSEFTVDVALPCSALHFFIYRKSDKLFPSLKESCEKLGSISCLVMMRMEVKCPYEEEENAELLGLCEVRDVLAWYKEFRETEWEGRRRKVKKLPKMCLKHSPLSHVFSFQEDAASPQNSKLLYHSYRTAFSTYLQKELCILLSGNRLRMQRIVVILALKTELRLQAKKPNHQVFLLTRVISKQWP